MAGPLAAILVVPLALILVQWFGWQSPFLLFGLCGLLLALITLLGLALPVGMPVCCWYRVRAAFCTDLTSWPGSISAAVC
ncbi:hypothetical protein [Aeromonas veronii]|uniref:hypothetical protein n=1 Tax=Aeromonas veronii TaxID=654 RepID=UPI0023AB3B67|nr:hypothetical protein [Aeromonas veronii]